MESSGDDSESLVSEPVDESLWPGGVVYYIFDGSLSKCDNNNYADRQYTNIWCAL